MKNNKTRTIPFRRKREGKTDYKKRLGLLKSKSLRLVIRKSNKHIIAQLVSYSDNGDKVEESVSSNNLKEQGWDKNTGNIPAAYLTGLLIGKKANGKKAILDLGLQSPKKGSRLFAVLKGAIDGGLVVNSDDQIFPSEDTLSGKHISEDIVKSFNKVKEKVLAVKK
jgi:large subunit ribosomal protein L18